jgi:hypothetical protein
VKKLALKIAEDIRARISKRVLAWASALILPLIPEARHIATTVYLWLVSSENIAIPTSCILLVLGVLGLVLAYCYRLGIGELGYTNRIKAGFRRWMIRFKPLAEQQALAAKDKLESDAAFHERLMKHKRSQSGEID